MTISIIIPSRAENSPLDSVIKSLPEANIIRFFSDGMSPAVAMSQALTYFTVAYRNAATTRVVCLGDRYETLAAALAAMFVGIPVAHIHGGETTTGAFDDAMRDAITRMASLHFVAIPHAANRVAQLLGRGDGELFSDHYRDIHLVGAPGLDGIEQGSAKRDRKLILATYHPETRAKDYGQAGCKAMLDALSPLCPPITSPDFNSGYDVWFCGVNNDPGNEAIRTVIETWMIDHQNARDRSHLTHDVYLARLQEAALVIGNSSSIPIESVWVGCPSVLIGDRQNGRPLGSSVFQWRLGDEALLDDVILKALAFNGHSNPFYCGGPVGQRIATILRQGESK